MHQMGYRNRLDENIIARNKARLVAKTVTKKNVQILKETFAPVARIEAILINQTSLNRCKMCHFKRIHCGEMYVEQGLYGLKQAPTAWYEKN